jgi:hypothetical protein
MTEKQIERLNEVYQDNPWLKEFVEGDDKPEVVKPADSKSQYDTQKLDSKELLKKASSHPLYRRGL